MHENSMIYTVEVAHHYREEKGINAKADYDLICYFRVTKKLCKGTQR